MHYVILLTIMSLLFSHDLLWNLNAVMYQGASRPLKLDGRCENIYEWLRNKDLATQLPILYTRAPFELEIPSHREFGNRSCFVYLRLFRLLESFSGNL